jgi:hypothetical protein
MINPWTQGRVPGARMIPTLGPWQNRRKLASAAWVPPQWARLSLEGAHMFWYQFPELVLSAGQTDLTRVTVAEDFWILAILARASRAAEVATSGTFRALIYEDQNTYKYAKYGVNQNIFCSTSQEPGLLKIPHFIAAGSPVNCKIQNLDGSHSNTVDLCMFGVSGWWRS